MGREARAKKAAGSSSRGGAAAREKCGLCGKSRNPLIRTDCCGRLICNDEDSYVAFSYARNSCSRNHRRFTLCGYHHTEGHTGDWKTCTDCRESFETEMYVYYGTNAYNFEKLENPPSYEPTRCRGCGSVISLGDDPYTRHPDGSYDCEKCWEH